MSATVTDVSVSDSELSTFRSCRERHRLRFREHLTPKVTPKPLALGSIIHAGIQGAYDAVRNNQLRNVRLLPLTDAQIVEASHLRAVAMLRLYVERANMHVFDSQHSDEERERLIRESNEVTNEAGPLIERFVRRFVVSDQYEFEILATEHPFVVPVLSQSGKAMVRTTFRGQIDLVKRAWDGDRRLVVDDHKSTSESAWELDSRFATDSQLPGYVYAMRQTYPSAGEVSLNVIRKKGPSVAKVNLDGTVSIAPIDTTREVYDEALSIQESVGHPNKKGERVPTPRTVEQLSRLGTLPVGDRRYAARHTHYYGDADVRRWLSDVKADIGLLRMVMRGKLAASRNGSVCVQYGRECAVKSVCVDDNAHTRSAYDVRPYDAGRYAAGKMHIALPVFGGFEEDVGEG